MHAFEARAFKATPRTKAHIMLHIIMRFSARTHRMPPSENASNAAQNYELAPDVPTTGEGWQAIASCARAPSPVVAVQ